MSDSNECTSAAAAGPSIRRLYKFTCPKCGTGITIAITSGGTGSHNEPPTKPQTHCSACETIRKLTLGPNYAARLRAGDLFATLTGGLPRQ